MWNEMEIGNQGIVGHIAKILLLYIRKENILEHTTTVINHNPQLEIHDAPMQFKELIFIFLQDTSLEKDCS